MRLPLIFLAILFSLISGPAGLSQTNPPPPNVSQPPVPLPVDGQALFYIKTGILYFTTQVRAETISQTIKKVAQNEEIDPRAIHPVEFEEYSEILAGKLRNATFTDLDAHHQASFMARIYSDLHENIQDTFNEAGTEIISAHYRHVRDGSRTAIPDAYLPRDYEPRALRVHQNPTPGEETWRTGEKESEK